MERIAVLGSTGSIGTSSLDVISNFPERFKVVCLSTYSNEELLSRQVRKFRPEAVCIGKKKGRSLYQNQRFNTGQGRRISVYEGDEGLCGMLRDLKIDTVVVGIVGSSALLPVLTAIDRVKKIALANKEAIVMAGDIIMKKAKQKRVKVVPVDSEHSAIFQCISSHGSEDVRNIYLTGSGGPLLRVPKKRFKYVSAREAVNHPRWRMGKKISVDSATFMNKGLEVIEAHHLFGLGIDRIKVLIHPQAVVHSMVEFVDGSILAHMGTCDMRIPIQYALTYPSREDSSAARVDFKKSNRLNFYSPDMEKFPCLKMAYWAAKKGGTYPCVLNAANEISVGRFLKGQIKFTDISKIIKKILGSHKARKNPGLKDILDVDRWARIKTEEALRAVNR